MVMHDSTSGSRALFADLSQYFGPLVGFGKCLEPQYPSGCLFWIDPHASPKVGDLVWYRWSDAWCAHLRKTLGPDFTFTGGAKWLRAEKGRRYLESNEGRALLTSEWIIVGPVVATFLGLAERGRSLLRNHRGEAMNHLVTLYDRATGQIVKWLSIPQPWRRTTATQQEIEQDIEGCVPDGHGFVLGHHDPRTSKIDVASGAVVSLSASELELAAAQESDRVARARIAELEATQLRSLREAVLQLLPDGDPTKARLAALDAQIAAQRVALTPSGNLKEQP
jgi:hypothetical protein